MRKNEGITMVSLAIIVVLLLILAGISIGAGNNMIKRSELENIKTNMLLIEVKGKEYVEKANFNLGNIAKIDIVNEEEKQQEIQNRINNAKEQLVGIEIEELTDFLEDIGVTSESFATDNSNNIYYYTLSTQNLIDMGLPNLKSDNDNGWYIVKYDVKNIEVEVYNTRGFKVDNNTYYSANEINNLSL